MPDALKVLGQANPAAATRTDLYTVPGTATTGVTVSSVVVCNRGPASIKFRIAVAPAGAVDDPRHYLYWDVPVPANDTFVATIGVTMAPTDVLRVQTDTPTVSFSAFGVESSP